MPLWTKVLAAAGTATVSAGLLVGVGDHAGAATVTFTVTGGKANYGTINERSQPKLTADVVGRAAVGSKVTMKCRVQGDAVENNARWISSGSFYIADAFIAEDTGDLPECAAATRPAGQKSLAIVMEKQVQDQWCWDASGLTIAKFWGFKQYNQYDFCRLAARNNQLDCNNQPATLGDMANGLANIGIRSSGRDLFRNASFNEVSGEIDGGRPLAVRFGWRSGGGHMNVIYGYDPSSRMVAVGDPWRSTQTYTWWNFDNYVNNNSFQWTHSRIGIHN